MEHSIGRKPIPRHVGSGSEGPPQDSDSMSSGASFSREELEPLNDDGGGDALRAIESDTLVLNKAKIEELALLLLNLVGKTPPAKLTTRRRRDDRAKPGTRAVNSSAQTTSNLDPGDESVATSEPPSPPSDSDRVSQALLRERPWIQAQPATGLENDGLSMPGDDETHVDLDNETGPDRESIPLVYGLRSGLAPGLFHENSLYKPESNHAWLDLDTELGPGKYLETAHPYLLHKRASGSWPKVVPFGKREAYIVQLWNALTLGSPAPDRDHIIASDLGHSREPGMQTDRPSQRPTSKKTAKSKRRKLGLSAIVTYQIQAISRAMFSTVDSSRARLPSTLYLRMLGQNLFADCLATDDEGFGETQLRILIASLKILARELSSETVTTVTEVINSKPSVAQLAKTTLGSATTVWDLLASCYRSGVLRQPDSTDEDIMRSHVLQLFSALQLVNVFTPRIDETLLQSMQLDELLGSYVWPLCSRATVRREESAYPLGKSEYFGKRDLNVIFLQNIGALNILWTRYIDDHLTLDSNTSELRIFWPAWALANLPCTTLFSSEPVSSTLRDLVFTYNFLFYSEYGLQAAIGNYNNLDPPTWVSTMSGVRLSALTTFKTLIGDVRYHFMAHSLDTAQEHPANFGMVRFSDCGVFENRVRILKGYMDSQRPTGLTALWRDKRDSGQWYTFWLVLVIGGISIFLAIASFAATVAQTAIAAKALDCQIASANGGNCSSPASNTTTSTSSSTSTTAS